MNENEIIIPAGSDLVHTIHVDDENGNTINCTIFNKIVIIVYHANGAVVAKYSLNPAVGYETIDVTDAVNGNLTISLLTVHTVNSPLGILLTEVHCQYVDLSKPDDAVLDRLSRDNYLCTITKSITGGQTLP